MKRAVILFHGDRPSEKVITEYISLKDIIICTDGAAQYALDAKLIPHVVIGDFDSIAPRTIKELQTKQVQLISYPAEKNETDSELACMYALEQGCTELVIFGLRGDRFDHEMANILLLSEIAKQAKVRIITETEICYFVINSLKIVGKKGEYLSLIPLTGTTEGVLTTGLRYPLRDEELLFGRTRGVSNEFEQSTATVRLKKGILLVVHRKTS